MLSSKEPFLYWQALHFCLIRKYSERNSINQALDKFSSPKDRFVFEFNSPPFLVDSTSLFASNENLLKTMTERTLLASSVLDISEKESAKVKFSFGQFRSNSKISETENSFQFNRRDSTYHEASIPKISYSS